MVPREKLWQARRTPLHSRPLGTHLQPCKRDAHASVTHGYLHRHHMLHVCKSGLSMHPQAVHRACYVMQVELTSATYIGEHPLVYLLLDPPVRQSAQLQGISNNVGSPGYATGGSCGMYTAPAEMCHHNPAIMDNVAALHSRGCQTQLAILTTTTKLTRVKSTLRGSGLQTPFEL